MIRSMPEDFGKEVRHASCIRIYIFIRRVRVMKGIREIAITDMPEVSIGNVQSDEAKTGVTVLLFDKKGAVVGVDISGGGPASRETPLTSPVTADNPINAIVLSGGSAYGLAAADGVMRCLEDHGIGFETGYARVPLVCPFAGCTTIRLGVLTTSTSSSSYRISRGMFSGRMSGSLKSGTVVCTRSPACSL